MSKNKKQSIVDTETEFKNISLTPSFNVKSDNFKCLNLIIHHPLNARFNILHNSFIIKTQVYDIASKNAFLSQMIQFLTDYFKKEGFLKHAQDDFIFFIGRRGKRPKSDRFFPKKEGTGLFFRIPKPYYSQYIDLIYSFLANRDDLYNRSYSVSYFFEDFLDLIELHFESFVQQYIKNKK